MTTVVPNPPAHAAAWPSVRDAVLARDEYTCRDCEESFGRPDLDVHHLVPRARGGDDDPANLVTLCDGCHAARHPNLQVSLSRRMLERWALRLARLLDRSDELPDLDFLPLAMRLLGKDRLWEGQLEAIVTALSGQSMLVVRPTGSGKSLCYQAPALLAEGTALVLSPLKALMRDQIGDLQRLKIPATFINGDIGPSEKAERYELLAAGVFKFLYCAPERFGDRVRKDEVVRLSKLRPSFLVVDEAHCVDRWGQDFRPDYGRLGSIRKALGDPPVLAFTATAGTRMQHDILQSLGVESARRLVTGADRPNIALIRHRISSNTRQRADFIAPLIKALTHGKAMIFVPTINVGKELREALEGQGVNMPFYYAGLPVAEREAILGRFTGAQEPALDAVICTNAFGMGIDISNVRLVINYHHPACVEDYLQEFGRAGRDGRPAVAILLENGESDKGLLEYMARRTVERALHPGADTAGVLKRKNARIETMNALARGRDGCFRQALLKELEGNRWRPRASASWRILRWVFEEKRKVSSGLCCDRCDPDRVAAILEGNFARLL